jgi:large subunit ribosomal protein L10e
MRAAFGKNVSLAARMERNQIVLSVSCTPTAFGTAKLALWKASMKFPTPCYIDVEKGKELVV